MEKKTRRQIIDQIVEGVDLNRTVGARGYELLNILSGHRNQKLDPNFNPKYKTLGEFLEFSSSKVQYSKSQLFQDLWVLFELGNKKNGYFVEFGATDGEALSNSYMLEKVNDWNGICLEPNPSYHTALKSNRACYIDHRCVYKNSGEKIDLMCTENGIYSRIKTINPLDGHEHSNRQKFSIVAVKTVTLNDALDHYKAPDEIDYVSIDTEGSEYEILKAFDFSKRRVNLFTIEHNFTTLRADIHSLMKSKGYIRRFPELSRFDDWYMHRSLSSN